MTTMTHNAEANSFSGSDGALPTIDLECCHKVINRMVEVLQRKFKEDTHFTHPLMPPQANIIFALGKEVAESMINYMTATLQEMGGFEEGEFRFTCRSGANGETLQRVRLEFPDGVNSQVIRKLLVATDRLERILPGVMDS